MITPNVVRVVEVQTRQQAKPKTFDGRNVGRGSQSRVKRPIINHLHHPMAETEVAIRIWQSKQCQTDSFDR